MIGRIVPIGVGWVLSGTQQMLGASQRAAAFEVAAELAAGHSRLVFRNPEKVAQGWELARKQRAMFIEFFGSDLIVVPGPEVGGTVSIPLPPALSVHVRAHRGSRNPGRTDT